MLKFLFNGLTVCSNDADQSLTLCDGYGRICVESDAARSGTFAEDRYVFLVAAEIRNFFLNPLKCQFLIEQAQVSLKIMRSRREEA